MLKVVLTSITTGVFFLIALGGALGDVDDNWWIFLLIGIVAGIFIGFKLKDKFLDRKLGVSLIVFFLFLSLSMIVYGVYGAISGQDIITGRKYDGMEGMLPFLILIISLGPLFLAFTLKLFLRKKYKELY